MPDAALSHQRSDGTTNLIDRTLDMPLGWQLLAADKRPRRRGAPESGFGARACRFRRDMGNLHNRRQERTMETQC